MKNITRTSVLLAGFIAVAACDLEQEPITSVGKEAVFSSEDGLEAYSWSFYNNLTTGTSLAQKEDNTTDLIATTTLPSYFRKNSYNESSATSWSWTALRNINYFIVNNVDEAVPENVRNEYEGLARFFRAWFYYDKIKTYGDVPWIDVPIDPDDDERLYAPRDSRELVMENVWEDLQYACENITKTEDATCSTVTKWVAYAFASRIALFEGTFRKYHGLNLSTSAETWLQRSANAAKYVMDNSGKALYKDAGTSSYRALFITETPYGTEALMSNVFSSSFSITHAANWVFTSATAYNCANFLRAFINTFLMEDGTPYTDTPGYETATFAEECTGRDPRLAATIRTPGYMAEGKIVLPNYGRYARLGYQPLKFCVDQTSGGIESSALNTNALPIFRYAEVLLNYAEAKAELGTLTDDEWASTVGAIRERAGITGGLASKPTKIDAYLQQTFYPDVTDPVILEIRRERGVELCLEGFRYDDIRRWHTAETIKNLKWAGINIPALDTPLDMDGNGTYDVIYYTSSEKLDAACTAAGIDKSSLDNVPVTLDQTAESLQVHPNGDKYQLVWMYEKTDVRVWGEKQYLYPIPYLVMVKNSAITQNPGWENGAYNDGN